MREPPLSPEVAAQLRAEADHRLDFGAEGEDVVVASHVRMQQLVQTARAMIRAEQEELIAMWDAEGLPDALVRPMLQELDVRDQALAARHP